MRRKPLADPVSIANVLENVLKKKGIGKKIVQYSIFEIWGEIVGPTIAKQTKPFKMQGDCLVVTAKSAAWANELTYIKPMILKKIREKIPCVEIKDIRFMSNPKF